MRESNVGRLSSLEIDESHSEFLAYKYLLIDLKETYLEWTFLLLSLVSITDTLFRKL
ncbi:hypothetical protein CLV24_102385 [Pontibacter ummariensis]|uniref:Uncharacterized protein n=1 Tax=Pontibacter ummariensis TaxID=1610492 RepID=A0A239BMK3_9BACT|nr:hypothetical protein CLV24_102385 [Pontibacter ummariensis]SNS08849.1 hypothetical protein SAMN06296052_10227 [Pontibacter ummariensis]